MNYSVTLNIGGPRDPAYLLEVMEAFAECVRVANHLTRDRAALRYPAEADTLIRYLSSAAERLPQLLVQVGAWLEQEAADSRIRVARGEDPVTVVIAAQLRLERAAQIAAELQEALDNAASVTTGLAGVPGDEEDDDG